MHSSSVLWSDVSGRCLVHTVLTDLYHRSKNKSLFSTIFELSLMIDSVHVEDQFSNK